MPVTRAAPAMTEPPSAGPAAPEIELRVLDQRLHAWGLPRYQTALSAGIDLYACLEGPLVLEPQAPAVLVPTGIAILMNRPDMAGFILARSGLGHRQGLVLGQGVGTLDADYAAQIFVSAWLRMPKGSDPVTITPGDRVAQLVFVPILRPRFRVVEEFAATTGRGLGGFGSTGIASS